MQKKKYLIYYKDITLCLEFNFLNRIALHDFIYVFIILYYTGH